MARFSDLPDELVVKILALLPVDSLMRFKCIQKSWYSLIAHPRFIVKQLQNQICTKNNCVLLRGRALDNSGEEENLLSLLSFDNKTAITPGEDNASAVGKVVDIPFYKNRTFCQFLVHFRGIICLVSPSGRIILANPAIREFRELPDSSIHSSQGLDENKWLPFCHGFGYDTKSNDFKVIRFLCFLSPPSCDSPSWVEVYTLSTNSWRMLDNIDFSVTEDSYIRDSDCQYINGACYWFARHSYEGQAFILSFSMSDEVFRKIPVPNSSINAGQAYQKLMVLTKSLAFVLFDNCGSPNIIEIWVMDEFGANRTWRKQFTIQVNSRLRRPLVFWKNDDLIVEDEDGMLRCINLDTQEIKALPVQRRLMQFSAAIYMSSLVSVRGGNQLALGDYDSSNRGDGTSNIV